MSDLVESGDVLSVSEFKRLVFSRMSEATFQQQVINLARDLGWFVYHTHDSRRSEPGFPDLVIVGYGRVLFCELKTARGKLSTERGLTRSGRQMPSQVDWLRRLREATPEVYVLRPSDSDLIPDLLSPSETAARWAAMTTLAQQAAMELGLVPAVEGS